MALRTSLAITAALLFATPAGAMPVFDTANHAQNMLQAARALEQITNQVRSLQNEAQMLAGMAKNLSRVGFPELDRIRSSLGAIDQLMGEARAIGFKLDALDERFASLFPGAGSGVGAAEGARARFAAAMDSYRHTMAVQARVAETIAEDAGTLADLVARSQGAEGSLQAQQAANQLMALAAKQQMQLEGLMAAEFRSQAIDRARRLQAEQDGREATRRFLGEGRAYTPR